MNFALICTGFRYFSGGFRNLANINQKHAEIRRKWYNNMVRTAAIHNNTEPTFSSKRQ